METDQAIGTTLPAIMAGVTIETASNAPSIAKATATVRLDDQALAKAEALANSPLPALPPCDDGKFNQFMRTLATLARRASDDDKGELLVAIYRRMLGHYPRDALAFMVETAIVECDWFPSVKQCLEILSRWKRNDGDVQSRSRAAVIVREEHRARFDEIMGALERREIDDNELGTLSIRMLKIAAERGYVRLNDDGFYRVRPLPVPTDG